MESWNCDLFEVQKQEHSLAPLTNSKKNDLCETNRNTQLCDYYPEITANVKVQQTDCSAKD